MSRKLDSKETILDAAEAVVADLGAAHLTLEAVASHADMSKGGLLYHYPSKEALLVAMIARLLERASADRAGHQKQLRSSPSADLQAHILAGFEEHLDRERVCASLLAAGANDPKLLDPVRAWQKRQFEELVRSKRHPARATVILLALDGLWLNELLEISPLKPKERRELLNELLDLAKSAA